jgi:type I restriction enzyme S subunit
MEVPATWRRVRLGEVCEINPRLPSEAKLDDDTMVSFVPMAAVSEISGEITTAEERHYQDVKKGFTPFVGNDVLFAKITPSMENGKAAIARNLRNNVGFGSTEFHVIRCSDQVLPEYVFYFIRQQSFRAWAKSSFIGSAGQQRVPPEFLARILFLLPAIPEQQRIVEILRQADGLRHQRREILDQAKQLPAALFLEMFGDPRDYPKKWGTKPFGLFVTYSKYGPRFPDREYSEVGARILRTTDMEGDGSLRWWDSPVMPVTQEELKQHTLKPGTLLVSRSGTIGPVALFSQADEPCIAGAYLIEFGLSSEINHRFLTDFLLSRYGQTLLTGGSQSQTQANLNAPTIKKIAVPTPPRDLQDKYETMSLEIRKSISAQKSESKSLELLTSELTRSAFSGEVTQRWREAHGAQLEKWLRDHLQQLPKRTTRISFKEIAPPERTPASSSRRYELLNQLGELQGFVRDALRVWKGTLIPAEHLPEFMGQWPVEHLEDLHDQVLRALDQLAGLGLIARVSIPNQQGEYVTGYRVLRDEELTKFSDLQRLGAPA